jgi:hypothetical protein
MLCLQGFSAYHSFMKNIVKFLILVTVYAYGSSHSHEVQSFLVLGYRKQGTLNKLVCT